jgi:hypothetical protein
LAKNRFLGILMAAPCPQWIRRRQLTSVPSPASARSENSKWSLRYSWHAIQLAAPITGSPPTSWPEVASSENRQVPSSEQMLSVTVCVLLSRRRRH